MKYNHINVIIWLVYERHLSENKKWRKETISSLIASPTLCLYEGKQELKSFVRTFARHKVVFMKLNFSAVQKQGEQCLNEFYPCMFLKVKEITAFLSHFYGLNNILYMLTILQLQC